jgi:hypothetical protein
LLSKDQFAKGPDAFAACSAQAYHQMVHAVVAALELGNPLVPNLPASVVIILSLALGAAHTWLREGKRLADSPLAPERRKLSKLQAPHINRSVPLARGGSSMRAAVFHSFQPLLAGP